MQLTKIENGVRGRSARKLERERLTNLETGVGSAARG